MSKSRGLLRGRLEGVKIKERDEQTSLDVSLSIPLRQEDGSVDLTWLGELVGRWVVIELDSEQARLLPLGPANSGGETS